MGGADGVEARLVEEMHFRPKCPTDCETQIAIVGLFFLWMACDSS